MDFVKTVVNEIALEGLDGITISGLWLRLADCQPAFTLSLDADSKRYLWSSVITRHSELSFFALEEPRAPLVITKRSFGENCENTAEDLDVKDDPYPYKLVQDGDIVGSCSTYYKRQNITNEIRPSNGCTPSLDDVMKKYGERLVIVASQMIRRKVLLNDDTDQAIALNEKAFCLLEKIARSRYNGTTTHGCASVSRWMNESCKFVYYLKNKLCRCGLITSQAFFLYRPKGQSVSGKLLHLKKFYVEVRPRSLIVLEKMTKALADRPNHMMLFSEIRAEMNVSESYFKRILGWSKNYVRAETVFAKDMFPDAEQSVHYHKTVKKLREVRVVKLLKMYTYSAEGKDDFDGDDSEEDEVGDDEADDDIAELDTSGHGSVPIVYELPLLNQVYSYLVRQGGLGANKADIGKTFRIPRLEGRRVCCSLERLKVVHMVMHDVGRQREKRYVAKSLVHTSSLHKELIEEGRKILERHEENKKIKEDTGETDVPDETLVVTDAQMGETSKAQDSEANVTEQEEYSLSESIIKLEETATTNERNLPKNVAHITAKMLKRANIILDIVRQAKVIDSLPNIQKHIIEEEKQENLKGRMDKKSLLRLVKKLEKDGQLKIFKSSRKIDGEEKEVMLICDVSMTPDNSLVKNAIESAFNRKLVFDRNTQGKMSAASQGGESGDALMANLPLLKSDCKMSDMQFDSDASNRYGYLPRMKRYQTTHEFLWYLVYGYGKPMFTPGGDSLILDEDTMEMPSLPADQSLDASNHSAPVYINEASFRRFLPPLSQHDEYGPGWFLLGDVLLLLPLTIFLQVIRFNFKSEELERYLADPILKWLILSQIPSHLRRMLMFERRYVFQFYDLLQQMNKMGLISIGLRDFKEKEQIFMYLHKNASIVDTIIPKLTPEERPVKRFSFDSAHTVREYWFNLQWICTNTPLSHISMHGPRERLNKSNSLERFQDVILAKAPEDIKDDGRIPGDGKGAAGLDSSFFSHKKSNWTTAHMKASGVTSDNRFSNSLSPHSKMTTVRQVKERSETVKKKPRKRKRHSSCDSENSQTEQDDISVKQKMISARKLVRTSSGETVEVVTKTGIKPKGGGKGIKHRTVSNKKVRAATLRMKSTKKTNMAEKDKMDELDRIAKMRMTRERSDWSSREDSMLLLWKVCLVFLSGWRRDSVIPFSIIRDYLHKELPESLNKTTLACKRRLANMMKIRDTIDNINLYVGEAFQDKELVNEFLKGQCYKKIQSATEQRCALMKKCYEKLREKFLSGRNLPAITLPDTKEELLAKYEFYKPPTQRTKDIQEPSSLKDIHFAVLQNVIHCATLLDDKICRAHELYHMLSQYPESLLNGVFNSMKSDGIITKIKKGTVRRRTKLNALPAVGMGTYMLSQRYTYFWITKYPRPVFGHSYEAYQPMKQKLKAANDDDDDDESSPWILVQGIAGYAAMIIALLTRKQLILEITVPEQIVTLDSEFPKKARSSTDDQAKTESDAEEEAIIDEAERLREEQTASSSSAKGGAADSELAAGGTTIGGTIADKEVIAGVVDDVTSQNEGDGRRGDVSQLAVSVKTLSAVEFTPVKSPSAPDVEMPTKIKSSLSRPVASMSHGQHGYKSFDIMHLDPQDHLVVNACTIRARLRTAEDADPKLKFDFIFEALEYIREWNNSHTNIHPKTASCLFKMLRVLQPANLVMTDVLTQLQNDGHCSLAEVELMTEMHERIKENSYFGLTASEAKTAYGSNPLFKRCLNLLLETRIVVRVGVTEFRYVSHQHVQPWIIHSYKNLKGRGTNSQADESEDLVRSLSLKDFPGAPALPGDHSISPSQSSTAQPPGGSSILLSGREDGGLRITTKRPADDDSPGAKRARTAESDEKACADPASDGDRAQETAPATSSHNAAMEASPVITCPRDVATPTVEAPKMTTTTMITASSSDRFLVKTITPDQQVVEEKFIDKTELSLTGRKLLTRKVQKREASFSEGSTSPVKTSTPADVTAAASVDATVCPTTEVMSSNSLDTSCHKAGSASVKTNTSSDTPVPCNVVSSGQNVPSVVTSAGSTSLRSRSAVIAGPSATSAASESVSEMDVIGSTPLMSAASGVSDVASQAATSASKTAIASVDCTELECEKRVPSVKPSPSGVTASVPKPNYAIQVKLPSNVNMKDIDMKGVLKQIQLLIKSGRLNVTGSQTQVLTVDIGNTKILVSVIPKAPKQHDADGRCAAQSSTTALSSSEVCTKQMSPITASAVPVPSSGVTLVGSQQAPQTDCRKHGQAIPGTTTDSSCNVRTEALTKSKSDVISQDKMVLGSQSTSHMPFPVAAVTSPTDIIRASPIRLATSPSQTHLAVSSGTSVRASPMERVRAASDIPIVAQSPPRTTVLVSCGTPASDCSSRSQVITPSAMSTTDSPESVTTIKRVRNATATPRQPALRHSPRVTPSTSAGIPVARRASARKKSMYPDETLPQVDGTSDQKPEQDDCEMGENQSQTKGPYTFSQRLGAPPVKGTYQSVRLVCRPWKTPEGTVNRAVLQMMLEGLLCYIMINPSITWQALTEKYSSVLQPVPLMELTEMLEIIGCVYRVCLKSFPKPTLFSRRIKTERGVTDDICQPTDTLFPTSDCVLKMGQYVSQSQPSKR